MKLFKKLAGMLLATIMVLSMSTVAFAAQGTNDNSGSITINNAEEGHIYNAYQILVLESYNTEAKAYSYKANSDWADWLITQTQYVSIDDQGYVTWVKDADPAAFAKAALAYAEEANINPVATKTADGTTVKFEKLNLGYYLVDTTLGTLCSLDTAVSDVEMFEKNEQPPVKKEVKEDSTGNWGDENTAEIGQTVEFRSTIGAKPGAQGYVLHDVMSAGLTLDPDSIEATGLKKGQDANSGDYHVVTTGLSDGCTFEVVFHQSYLDTITTNTDIVVTYSAVVNENAQVSPSANPNKTTLKYGEDSEFETVPSETKTYTFKVDVVKTDDKDKVLDGAQFKLYDAKTGGNEIALVKVSDGVYRLAKDGETGVEYITTVNGQLEIKGFDANTNYYLEETKAPDGYNKLAERVEIAVKNANLEASVSNDTWQSGGVHIVNKAGDLLPTTGGMGTTILYIIGGVLVIGAGAVLIIRRRTRK
ncbi:MAG TPA: SpaH/EbpB family LPXTG-anchored major pilin [Candidatus Mediterraneibacter guildfordensis]|nr:SpaH/EbpB family LPXTG-anchored major pilin [Candidatus Mediterraneibacter guildfordensis]